MEYSAKIIDLAKKMEKDYVSKYLHGQLVRSGLSSALNYAESQSSESSKDYIHKMKIALKELRETRMNMRIIERTALMSKHKEDVRGLLQENNELISIFVVCISKASQKLQKRKI